MKKIIISLILLTILFISGCSYESVELDNCTNLQQNWKIDCDNESANDLLTAGDFELVNDLSEDIFIKGIQFDIKCDNLAKSDYNMTRPLCNGYGYTSYSCIDVVPNPCINWSETPNTKQCSNYKYNKTEMLIMEKRIRFEIKTK